MVKTVDLTGTEAEVSNLGGKNTAIYNKSDGVLYASASPNVTPNADGVIEVPAGGYRGLDDTNGVIYLLGTGKVELTGTDYPINFKQPSQSESGGGGGTSDVTKAYVDAQDSTNLGAAKAYTNTEISAVWADVSDNINNISALQSDMTAAQTAIAANTTAVATADSKAAAAQTAADNAQAYTDTKANALDTRVTANETAIAVLNGTGEGSVKKAISDGIAEIVADAPEDFDTLKEMSDWISGHEDSAAAMNSQIQTNTTDILALEADKADKSEIPTTLPANGGDADTVNGHTVNTNVPINALFTDTTYAVATTTQDGLESKEDKAKLDSIEPGAQVNVVTGVKGNSESDYRIGNINLTAANIGAAESSHQHSAANITSGVLPTARGGTGNGKGYIRTGAVDGSTIGEYTTAEGYNTLASASAAHTEGIYCSAVGNHSHAQGYATLAKGGNSMACGSCTTTWNANQLVIGCLNNIIAAGSPFVIGWGELAKSGIPDDFNPSDNEAYNTYMREGATLKNIFRVSILGSVYGVGAFNTSGADYAEYIKPWWDDNSENEDRRGYFVTIKNGKLRKAEPEDYIVGITSGNPSVIGNGDEDWLGRWQRDEFNELVYKDVEVDDYEEQEDENGNLASVKVGSHIEKHTVEVPEYDPTQEYIERKDRPEWSCVGMIGVLPLRDDGTCVAGGFAKCGEGGIATAAETWDCHKTFFVIERINDHIISVEMR